MPPNNPNPSIAAWPFMSSGGSLIHETLLHRDGTLSCSCGGWVFARKDKITGETVRKCTHTERLEPYRERVFRGEITAESIDHIVKAHRRVAAAPETVTIPPPDAQPSQRTRVRHGPPDIVEGERNRRAFRL